MKGFLAVAVVFVVIQAIHSQTELSDCLSLRQSLTANGDPPPGAFVPECEATGYYKAKQCHPSTGLCHCVSATGQKIAEPSRTLRSCHCLRRAHETQTTDSQGQALRGAYTPNCATDGRYEKVQCHPSTGFCWCANPETGEAVTEQARQTPLCT